MITPYIDRYEEIEEVPKEVKIRRNSLSRYECPRVGHEEKHSYHYREETRHESRVVESSCEFAKFLRTFSPVFDRIKDRVGDYIQIKGEEEDLKEIDAHFE